MRKKHPERHFVSHIVEHIIGVFVVLGIAGTSAYLTHGAFAQTLTLPYAESTTLTPPSAPTLEQSTAPTPLSVPTLDQSTTAEMIPVAFAVTPAPVTDCSGSQPMTRVLFAVSQLSGGTFVVTSNSGTSDMKLSWGEYPLPNGIYVWKGIPASGFFVQEGDTGTFELKGTCGETVGTETVTGAGNGQVSTGESTDTTAGTIIEMIPPHTSSFVPPILSRPLLKIFTENVPVTDPARIFDDEEMEFRIEEAAAKKITLMALANETGKALQVGNAVVDDLLSTKNTDIWVFFWDITNIPDGSYTMNAHVLRTDGTTIDTLPVTITIKHRKVTVAASVPEVTYDTDDNTVTTSLTVALPEKEEILERVNEPSACTNSLECMTFCESEADQVCASYAQYVVTRAGEDAPSFAEGVSAERVQLMLSEPKRRPQELPEVVTNAEEFFAYCSELTNEEVCIKALLRNDLATAESLEAKKTALLEEAEEEARIWGERTGARAFIDSDEDGVTDYDEINMYHTDPDDNDTDHDGFVDGEEILARTDPQGDSGDKTQLADKSFPPDEEVQLEDPLISGTTNSTLLAVSSVSALAVGTDDEGRATVKTIQLAGVSPPNSFVTLFVYSDPIVVTVKSDASGSWTYTLDRELPDGTHHVISTITDGGGRILAKSAALPFVKEAAAVSVGAETLPVNPGAPTFFSGASLYGIIAIVIALLGVSFSVLGFAVHNKKETDLTLHHST